MQTIIYRILCTAAISLLLISISYAQSSLTWETFFQHEKGITHDIIDMAVDSQGNSFVLLDFDPPGGTSYQDTLILLKYDPAGQLLWKAYDTLSGIVKAYSPMQVRNDGSVVIVVNTDQGSHNEYDTKVFDINGNIIASHVQFASYYSISSPFPSSLDQEDNLIVGGFSGSYAVIYKLNIAGGSEWQDTYQNPNFNSLSFFSDTKTDPHNNVIALGNSTVTTDAELFVFKYNEGGSLLWEKHYPLFQGNAMEQDSAGNLYIYGEDIFGTWWPYLTKLDSAGNQLWTKYFEYSEVNYGPFHTFYTDEGGNSLVLIDDYSPAENPRILRLGTNGDTLWEYHHATSFPGTFSSHEIIPFGNNRLLCLGDVYTSISNSFHPDSSVTEIFQLDETGTMEWSFRYPDAESNIYRIPKEIRAMDSSIFVSGIELFNPNNDLDIDRSRVFLYRFDMNSIPTSTPAADENDLFSLFPNPSSDIVHIQFFIQKSSETKIELLDVQGREIKTIARGNFSAGHHQLILERENLSAGIYLLHLKTGSGAVVQKIIFN